METNHIFHHGHKFEIVKDWPSNYFVWNIGRENFPFPCYLPLCKWGHNPEPWMRNIDVNSLKAIKVDSEDIALKCLDAAGRGKGNNTRDDYMKIING